MLRMQLVREKAVKVMAMQVATQLDDYLVALETPLHWMLVR
jgi:hypothetical protein